MRKTIVLLLVGVMFQTGCATIVQSGPDQIQVRSNPEGADVHLNGVFVGKTPTMVSIRRKDDALIEIKKEGYETMTVDRHKVLAGWFLGNILIGGGIGIAVDLIAHNQGKYSEDPIMVTLQDGGSKKSAAAQSH